MKPALSPSQLVYQRLLAGDPVEVIDQAEEFLEDKLLIEYYDDVLLDGIRLMLMATVAFAYGAIAVLRVYGRA